MILNSEKLRFTEQNRKRYVRGQAFSSNNSHSINTDESRNLPDGSTPVDMSTEYTANTFNTQNGVKRTLRSAISLSATLILILLAVITDKFNE